MPPRRVSSYTQNAPRPVVGSYWAWMGEIPPVLIRVTQVRWNGEEWWINSRKHDDDRGYWNDLTVFWEQCHIATEPGVPSERSVIRRGPAQPDELELPQ